MHDLDPGRTPMCAFGHTNLGDRWIPAALPPPCTAAVIHSGNAAAGGGFMLGGAPDSRRPVGAGLGGSQWRLGRLDVASWRRRARRSTVKLSRAPAPFRESAFARGAGSCRVCGQPVYRFGWHLDLWQRGPNLNAAWPCGLRGGVGPVVVPERLRAASQAHPGPPLRGHRGRLWKTAKSTIVFRCFECGASIAKRLGRRCSTSGVYRTSRSSTAMPIV
jgi:hypothetical protein